MMFSHVYLGKSRPKAQNDDKKIVKNYLLSPSVVLLRFANDNVEFGEELKVFKILTKYDDKLQQNDDHDYYDQDYDDQDPHDNDDHFKEAPL